MARGRIWLVVMVVAAVAVPSASASGVNCADCSGTYTGSWSAQVQFTGSSGTATTSLSLSWTETLKTPPGSTSGVWSLASAQGTISYTNSANPDANCTATLSPNGALASNITEFGPQVIGDQTAHSIMVNAYPPTYWSGDPSNPEPVASSDSGPDNCSFTNQTSYASGFFTSFSGPSCHYAGPSSAEAMTFPSETTTTMPDRCDAQGSDGSGTTGTATLDSTLTMSSPSVCTINAGDARRAPRAASSKLRVRPRRGPLKNSGDNTVATFTLSGLASGGCPPYSYSWQQDKAPTGAMVTPRTGSGQEITVSARCPPRRRRNGVRFIPPSCEKEPLKYTVTVRDSRGATAKSSIVIFAVFSEAQAFLSPGDPAERDALIKTLKGMNDALAEQCAVNQTVSDVLDTGAWIGSWGGLNPLPGPVSTPAAGGAACAHSQLDNVKQRFAEGARALRVAEKDPPARDFNTVSVPAVLATAPTPRCTGARAALCELIGRDREAADRDLEQAIVIANSIATTIDRHSGAVLAGDQRAAQLQDATYRAQLRDLARVLALDNRDRSKLAAALRRVGQDFHFDRSFTEDPVSFLRRAAAHLSTPGRSLAGAMISSLSLFKPSVGTSYVRDLSTAIPTAGL